jgi:hypothetical protein
MMVVSIMISACRKTLKGYIFSEYGNKTLKLVKDVLGGVLVESGAVSICDIFLLELTRDLVSTGLPNLWF